MNMPAGNKTAPRHALYNRASGPLVGWYLLERAITQSVRVRSCAAAIEHVRIEPLLIHLYGFADEAPDAVPVLLRK